MYTRGSSFKNIVEVRGDDECATFTYSFGLVANNISNAQ